MNILIYVPDLNQSWGGVRQYAVGLIRILAQDVTNNYFIYHNGEDPEILKLLKNYNTLNLIKDADVSQSSLEKRVVHFKEIANFFFKRLSKTIRLDINSDLERLLLKYNIDVIHSPYQYIPRVSSVKLILTLHDVQELHFPEFFSAEERANRATYFLDFIRRTDKVVVSYEHIKNDLKKYFSVEDEDIKVILLDMSKLWFEKFVNQDMQIDFTNIYEKFIFYPANTWEHKNHARLLEAIAYLKSSGIIVNLICSGHQNKYYSDVLQDMIEKLDIEKQVTYLGVVDEKTLYSLYKKCVGVVVPTVYEAGSFPLMESILLGVPVICSNVTSLPETIDNSHFTFNPFSVTEISSKIELLWGSDNFRHLSIKNSERVRQFLINTGALYKFINIYAELSDK